jgi:hypothetical protein
MIFLLLEGLYGIISLGPAVRPIVLVRMLSYPFGGNRQTRLEIGHLKKSIETHVECRMNSNESDHRYSLP